MSFWSNLWNAIKKYVPFVGGYYQKLEASQRRGETEPYAGFMSNVENAFSAAEDKYLGTGLTQAEQEANAFTAEREDIAWQRQMEASSTEYQRKVADLQAAGLNPMLAIGGSGNSVPAATSHGSVSPVNGNLSDLVSLATLPSQLKLMKAEAKNLDASANKSNTEARSTEQQIDYFERVKDFRAEAESLAGSIKHSEWKQIEQNISESKSRVSKLIAETNESERRSELLIEQAVLARTEADNIVYMQPFLSAELTARTAEEKAQCRLIAVEEAYQQKLIDEGSIEAAVRASNANASNAEIDAKTKEFTQAIRDGSLRSAAEKKGDWRSYITLGIYQGLSNAVKAARGNW